MTNHWLNYATLALISCVGGGLVGIFLAYLLALSLRKLPQQSSAMSAVLVVFPWRTVIASGLLVLLWSPFFVLRYGLGLSTGLLIMTLVMFFLALPLFTQAFLPNQPLAPLAVRLVTALRTLMVVALTLPVIVELYVGDIVRTDIIRAQSQLDTAQVHSNLLLVAAFIAIFDCLFGVIKVVLTRSLRRQVAT